MGFDEALVQRGDVVETRDICSGDPKSHHIGGTLSSHRMVPDRRWGRSGRLARGGRGGRGRDGGSDSRHQGSDGSPPLTDDESEESDSSVSFTL